MHVETESYGNLFEKLYLGSYGIVQRSLALLQRSSYLGSLKEFGRDQEDLCNIL